MDMSKTSTEDLKQNILNIDKLLVRMAATVEGTRTPEFETGLALLKQAKAELERRECEHTPEQYGQSQVIWHDRVNGLGTVYAVPCEKCGEYLNWDVSAD